MKKLILSTVVFMLIPLLGIAQTVPGFSYQAIARDANGVVIANKVVGVEISILIDAIDGQLAYVEEFFPTTNDYGIINLTIGTGESTFGDFESIDWSVGQYFVGVGLDTEGGSDFVNMSTSQLLSVPYAMYAKSAEIAESVKDIDVQTITELKEGLADIKTQLKSISYELMGNGSFEDTRDGTWYNWVEATDGNIWMATNLKAEVYTDGSPIVGLKAYDNDPSIAEEYGYLYSYEAIMESGKDICPDGYRMPTNAEWSALISKNGGPVFAGAKMKETTDLHWATAANGVTNSALTSVIPAGMVNADGSCSGLGTRAYIWTADECADNPNCGVAYQYSAEHNIVTKVNVKKDASITIRCIKIK